jgi:small subunit ribosomal protein S6
VHCHEYDTIILVRRDIEDAAVYALAEKVEASLKGGEGHILDRDDWGKRKLAYPIAKHQKAHFIRMNYLSPALLVAEVERRIRNEENVVRFMTVRLANSVDVPARIEQAAVQRAQREEDAKRRAAQAALGIPDDDDNDFDDDDDDDMGDSRASRGSA